MVKANVHPAVRLSQEAIRNKEVQEAAKTLAKYNLGVFVPHMHDGETGDILLLPAGVVACERDLKVSFEKVGDTGESLVPVAWKWNGTEIEVCANCCAQGPE